MSENVEVSIILPVYNKATVLRQTLDCIFRQHFLRWELLAVDDGSTDGSGQILDAFAARECRMQVFHQENKGVSAARNRGMKFARGTWVWFVDGDDLPSEMFLEEVFSRLLEQEADLIAGDFIRRYPDGRRQTVRAQNYRVFDGQTFPDVFMKEQYGSGYWGYLWNKILRRETIIRSGILFRETMHLAEDLQFLTELYRQKIQIRTVPWIAMEYRMLVPGGLSGRRIDYRQQLSLQLVTRNWILGVRENPAYSRTFDRMIRTDAVCLVLSEREERKKDWTATAHDLMKDPIVFATCKVFPWKRLISPSAWCIRREKYRLLSFFLSARKVLVSCWHRRKRWLTYP